jgi:hypothetical protein
MNKQIIFSLLLIATTNHGMKRNSNALVPTLSKISGEIILCHSDIIPQITDFLCIHRNYITHNITTKKCDIKTDIAILSCTNKFLRDYYANETSQQKIIRLCSLNNGSNYKIIADNLNFKKTWEKIVRFTNIALDEDKSFSENDLKESWYLNSTTTIFDNRLKTLARSLLQVALTYSKTKKVIQILDHVIELDFYYNDNENLLLYIACKRAKIITKPHYGMLIDFSTKNEKYDDLLAIAQRLLKKGMLPDGRESNTEHTPLMLAVTNKDKPLVRLLLEYGADPYTTGYNIFTNQEVDAFNFQENQGWLQNIIDDVAKNKKALGL